MLKPMISKSLVEHRKVTLNCPKHGPYEGEECWVNTTSGTAMHVHQLDKCACPKCGVLPLSDEEIARREQLAAEQQRRAMEDLRLEKDRKRREFYNFSGIPYAYFNTFFDDVKEHNQSITKAKQQAKTFVDNYDVMRENGVGMCFFGQVGTGKTMLAMAICNELFERYELRISMRYIEMWRIFQLEKRSWVTKSREDLERLKSVDLLIIDEIGVQSSTNFEESILMEILNYRVAANRNTIYISNLNPTGEDGDKTILSVLGERVYQRVVQNTLFVPFLGSSQRRPISSLGPLVEKARAAQREKAEAQRLTDADIPF